MKYRHFAVLFVLLCVGCTAGGPQFVKPSEAPADQALVYLFRPAIHLGAMIVPHVYIDDVKVFQLPAGGYADLKLQEGSHVIETRKSTNFLASDAVGKAIVNVKAGEIHYIVWVPDTSFQTAVPPISVAENKFTGNFLPLLEKHALPEIKKCRKIYP